MPPFLLALALAASAAQAPASQVGARDILTEALEALRQVPAGRSHSAFLARRRMTLSISADEAPSVLARLDREQNAILTSVGFLELAFGEARAHGVYERAARHLGLKLAPAIAHESCHAMIEESLRLLSGRDPPAFLEEELLCLHEELLLWRELQEAFPWEVARSYTDMDRVRDRLAELLATPEEGLAARTAEHYPDLPSVGGDRVKNLAAFYRGLSPSESAVSRRWERAAKEVERLYEEIDRGGRGQERAREALAKVEAVRAASVELSLAHPPRRGGDGKFFLEPDGYGKARAFLQERLREAARRLSGPDWAAWLDRRYPARRLRSAGDDEDRLRWALAAARARARRAPDLLAAGNPFHLKTARRLARGLGRDIRSADRELTLLAQHRIQRLLSLAETMAAQPGADTRRWTYLLLRSAVTEAREAFDLVPPWVWGRQRSVVDKLEKAQAGEGG